MNGIDVAKWQGVIDWHAVKTQGKVEFAILKATNKSNTVEGSLERNYAGCAANAIPVGVYRYVYAKSEILARAEAKAVVETLKDKKVTCGVWLDMEDASLVNLGKKKLTVIVDAAAGVLQDAGYKVGIYCNRNWYLNILDGAELSKRYPIWIARYPSKDNGTISKGLSPQNYAVAWQYSSKGKVPGIIGNVDLDIAFTDIRTLMVEEKLAVPPVPKYYPTYYGTSISIVTALKYLGIDCSYAYRKKVALANGITKYTGTAFQNNILLKKLKQGMLIMA